MRPQRQKGDNRLQAAIFAGVLMLHWISWRRGDAATCQCAALQGTSPNAYMDTYVSRAGSKTLSGHKHTHDIHDGVDGRRRRPGFLEQISCNKQGGERAIKGYPLLLQPEGFESLLHGPPLPHQSNDWSATQVKAFDETTFAPLKQPWHQTHISIACVRRIRAVNQSPYVECGKSGNKRRG